MWRSCAWLCSADIWLRVLMLVVWQVGLFWLFYYFRAPRRGWAYFQRKGGMAELDRDLALLFLEEAELETELALLHLRELAVMLQFWWCPCRHKGWNKSKWAERSRWGKREAGKPFKVFDTELLQFSRDKRVPWHNMALVDTRHTWGCFGIKAASGGLFPNFPAWGRVPAFGRAGCRRGGGVKASLLKSNHSLQVLCWPLEHSVTAHDTSVVPLCRFWGKNGNFRDITRHWSEEAKHTSFLLKTLPWF